MQYLAATETHLLPSKKVGQTFKIQVMQPIARRGVQCSYPVVYATDGNFVFDTLKGLAYGLQSCGEVLDFILVGIGYPGDSPEAGALLRGRDMTFDGYPRFGTDPLMLEGVLPFQAGAKEFYGAPEFQDFIAEELIPLIDAQYSTMPGKRVFFGHSLGGGFGLFTLFARPQLFEDYIVSSPGLTFHGESSAGMRYEHYDFMLDYVARCVRTVEFGSIHRLYMSVGTEEECEPALKEWRLTSSFYRMIALLQASEHTNLKVLAEAFVGETHMSAWPISFMHGVRALLAKARAHETGG